jgi:hypothetical protein
MTKIHKCRLGVKIRMFVCVRMADWMDGERDVYRWIDEDR